MIQPVLGRGDTIDPDIIAPTAWLAGRLIHARAGSTSCRSTRSPTPPTCAPTSSTRPGIPTGEYSLPWQTGIGGIAYNIERHRPRARRRPTTCSTPSSTARSACSREMRDTIGLDPAVAGHRHLDDHRLRRGRAGVRQARAGQGRRPDPGASPATTTWTTSSTGNFAACVGWSGDVVQLVASTTRTSASSSPRRAGQLGRHDGDAEGRREPRRRRRSGWTSSTTRCRRRRSPPGCSSSRRSKGVQEEVAKIDPELAENPLMFPDEEMLANVQHLRQPRRGRRGRVRRGVRPAIIGRLDRRRRRPRRRRR